MLLQLKKPDTLLSPDTHVATGNSGTMSTKAWGKLEKGVEYENC